MHTDAAFSHSYPARLDLAFALRRIATQGDIEAAKINDAADAVVAGLYRYGRSPIVRVYTAYAALAKVNAWLWQWRGALRAANPEAPAYLRAAFENYKDIVRDHGSDPLVAPLLVANPTFDLQLDTDAVGPRSLALARVALPVGLFAEEIKVSGLSQSNADNDRNDKSVPAAAFVTMKIDGVVVNDPHTIAPRESHDLDVELRLSSWPEKADSLVLAPITTEPASSYHLDPFTFDRPSGPGPYTLHQRRRLILSLPQAADARPYEFSFVLQFQPPAAQRPTAAGQLRLRLRAVERGLATSTGYAHVSDRIQVLRDQIRREIAPTDADMASLWIIMNALGNLAAQVLQDARFKTCENESDFQTVVTENLRNRPEIGQELEVHPHAGGGITDLSFRGIRIELKFESNSVVTRAVCQTYAVQALNYAMTTGKRVGVLCVLDASPKSENIPPVEASIHLHKTTIDDLSLGIVSVVMQGGLVNPSHLSKKRRSKHENSVDQSSPP